jgi:hypothetical protein
VLDPGGHVDSVAGLVLRGSLVQRLVRPVAVIVLRELGEDLPEMLLTEDQASDEPSDYDSRRRQTERDVHRHRNPSDLR